MERRRGFQGVLVGALVLASGCVAVPGPPATPPVAAAPAAPEVVPPQPGPAYVWVPGYWTWRRGAYAWVAGAWLLPPRPGYAWAPGYWAHRGRDRVWVEGHWSMR
jgi:hypothetical protein